MPDDARVATRVRRRCGCSARSAVGGCRLGVTGTGGLIAGRMMAVPSGATASGGRLNLTAVVAAVMAEQATRAGVGCDERRAQRDRTDDQKTLQHKGALHSQVSGGMVGGRTTTPPVTISPPKPRSPRTRRNRYAAGGSRRRRMKRKCCDPCRVMSASAGFPKHGGK